MSEKRKNLVILLPRDTHKALKRAALDNDVTLQVLTKSLIERWLVEKGVAPHSGGSGEASKEAA